MTAAKGIIIKEIIKDNSGSFWMSTVKDGLIYYDVSKKEIINHRQQVEELHCTLIFDEIKDILFIKEQDILFVATKRGFSKYDYHKCIFKKNEVRKDINDRVSSVLMVMKDTEEAYWVGSNSGSIYRHADGK